MSTENTTEPKPPIIDVSKLNQDLPDEYIASKIADEVGGVGAQYSVVITTYALFKARVLGNGFDIDNHYGWQCWDGAALLWQQLGLTLITGNGLAIGCWDLKRDVNKYSKFDLVTDVNALLPGDVVCMRPNHIGFFDGFDGAYMRILGQNQGGTAGPNGGMAFNIARITKASFAGAFRFKDWNKLKEEDMLTRESIIVRYRLATVGEQAPPDHIAYWVGKPSGEYDTYLDQNPDIKAVQAMAKAAMENANKKFVPVTKQLFEEVK